MRMNLLLFVLVFISACSTAPVVQKTEPSSENFLAVNS